MNTGDLSSDEYLEQAKSIARQLGVQEPDSLKFHSRSKTRTKDTRDGRVIIINEYGLPERATEMITGAFVEDVLKKHPPDPLLHLNIKFILLIHSLLLIYSSKID